MGTQNFYPALTAAECAARTGLTARALRLYEEHGLISPRRSAGGWRQYGQDELVRLNAITLLKTAGLTLSQIGGILGARSQGPDLQQMLAIQLENWRVRRADAERGQRIVEAALGRLGSGETLTVDELCELIQSLEMGDQQKAFGGECAALPGPGDDEGVLDSYTGDYRLNGWNVIAVRRESTKLFLQVVAHAPVELRPTGERDFEMLDGMGQSVSFDRTPDGAVPSLRLRTSGGDLVAERLGTTAAEAIRARLAVRMQEQKPLEGSSAAVRRLVDGLRTGNLNYEEMAPVLAKIARKQMCRLRTQIAFIGAAQSIEFKGVSNQGLDIYDVHHEHGNSRVQIMYSDGLISNALVAIKDGPVAVF